MLAPEVEGAFRRLVEAVEGPDALPAGGAAGITAIAMGLALGTKVLNFSSSVSAEVATIASELRDLRQRLMPEFAADCAEFSKLLSAFLVPRSDPGRADEIRQAWRASTAAPIRVACLAKRAEALLERCTGGVKSDLVGDLNAALELIRAGRRIAESNARENAGHLPVDEARELLARAGLG